MIPPHLNSRGEPCDCCGCPQSEAPHNTGSIVLVGCCALRHTHGAFRFDEETGEVTQWPLSCAEFVHTGPNEPDEVCAAHRTTKPEHTVVLTAHGPILPLDEPTIRLAIAEVRPGKPNDPLVEVRLTDGRRTAVPANILPRHPKYGVPALPVPRTNALRTWGLSLGLVKPPPYEVEVRGYNLLRSGALIPTVGRQFAQKRIDALFGRIQRAAFAHTFTEKERAMIERGADIGAIVDTKDRLMSVSLSADMDAGRIDISITSTALVVNEWNPERGGLERHHVAPTSREVAVVTPAITGHKTLALVA